MLKGFIWFSIVVTAIDAVLFVPALRPLRESIVPVTDWVPSMPYLFALGVWPGWRTARSEDDYERQLQWFARLASLLLVMFAVFGVVSFMNRQDGVDSANPWVRISPWRPLWAVAVPIAWALVLSHHWRGRHLVRKRSGQADSVRAEQPRPHSLRFALGLLAIAMIVTALRWLQFNWATIGHRLGR